MQSVRLPSRAVQRQHQLSVQALLVGIGGGERLELADERRSASERELCVDSLDLGGQPQFGQARHRAALGSLEDDIVQRGTAPERKGPRTKLHRIFELPRPSLGDQALELREVETVGVDMDLIAGWPRAQHVRAQLPPECVHVALHELVRGGRRPLSPELVDETVGGDRLIGVQQQHGQQRALLGGAEPYGLLPVENLERAKNPESHHPPRGRADRNTVLEPRLYRASTVAQPEPATVAAHDADTTSRLCRKGRNMRRKSIVGALALLAVAAMVAAGAISASSGEGGAQGANALVGTWDATISRGPVLPPLKSLQTFTKDQTIVESGSDSFFRSPAYGVWEYIGDRTFATTTIFHRFSTAGVYLGTQKINGIRQVSPDGETYTATAAFQVLDLDGNVIASGQAAGTAKRVHVERSDQP